MDNQTSYRRRVRGALSVLTSTTLLAAFGSAMAPTAADAAGAPSTALLDSCPAPFPVDELVDGMEATGLTVERGTSADQFTATIVGVVEDGIAPDMDMIIAETDSPAIERAGGIWAGMSGSPVYAPDGRLIGAVAYGLSAAPSNIAGITPAEAMEQVLLRPGTSPTTTTATTKLPGTLQQDLVASGAASLAEAKSGMQRLPLPVAVSGIGSSRLGKFAERLGKHVSDARAYRAGAAAAATTGSPADIFPGSNFAAAISYGDLTAAGVGTTTAVCDDNRVLAFGHPFLWSGRSSMSVHSASAVFVQRDNTFGSYKVANPLGVVGTLDQDRLAAVRGRLGDGPATVPVTSSITSRDDDTTRAGTTRVTMPEFVPDVAAFHLLTNWDLVFDSIGRGTADLRWVIQGKRASGAPFKVDVKNKYASPWDISFESIFDSFEHLWLIESNEFENVKIDSVSYTGSISSEFARYTVSSVQIRRPDGTYQPAPTSTPLKVVAGTRLNLRVVLAPYRNVGPVKNVDFSLVVPARTVGDFGWVDVIGGPGGGDEFDEFDELANGSAESFDDLLADLRGLVPNNSVTATLNVEHEDDTGFSLKQSTKRATVDQVVVGSRSFPIQVVAPRSAKPAVVDGKTWKLRSSLSSGSPTTTFSYGLSTDQPLMGDWNGDGKTTRAVFRDGQWRMRLTSTSTTSRVFTFGQPGDVAVAGDWNGDGRDDVGVVRNGRWLLRTKLSAGAPDKDFKFGPSTWRPVVGDWNGDGIDTVGVFRSGEWRLRNSNSAGEPRYTFTYGKAGDIPLVGDWNRDGRDRPGLYRTGKWYYRNLLTSGSSKTFTFGSSTSKPLVWN